MDIELARMGIVYLHLISCCVAIGMVLMSDVEFVRKLMAGKPDESVDVKHLPVLQKTVSYALLALWLTGAAIIALDMSSKGMNYLGNPKLQSKILVVCLLTLNGFALHERVLPALQRAGSLLHLTFSQLAFSLLTGAISAVSWFYAAMLGIGRPLNWKYSLVEIMAAYPVLIAAGFSFMALLTAWSLSRPEPGYQPTLLMAN